MAANRPLGSKVGRKLDAAPRIFQPWHRSCIGMQRSPRRGTSRPGRGDKENKMILNKLKNSRKNARGFTLIELMIVVAIIGILAAIAIPNFMRYQLRSRRTEGSVNVAAIRTSQIAYYGTQDEFLTAIANPADGDFEAPGKKAPWQRGSTFTNWARLGFEPEGDVYFQYSTTAGTGTESATFLAGGVADLDSDGQFSCWLFTKPIIQVDDGSGGTQPSIPLPTNCVVGQDGDGNDLTEFNKVYLAAGEDRF